MKFLGFAIVLEVALTLLVYNVWQNRRDCERPVMPPTIWLNQATGEYSVLPPLVATFEGVAPCYEPWEVYPYTVSDPPKKDTP